MRLEQEFTVGAPLDTAWSALSDAGVLAACIPGGELRRVDDVYTGRIEVDADGGRILCEATVRAVDRDDDEHAATVLLHARQVGGPAIGSVTVRSRLQAANGSTRVLISAEVISSGHETDGEALESAARELLAKAAEMLQQRAAAPIPPAAPAAPAGLAGPTEPLDAASGWPPVPATAPTPWQSRAALAGGLLVTLALVRRLSSRRRAGRR